ncbi:hypothetical protein A9Z42_0012290 [Trichoderma parareesei]|uniref:Uncharacterized protein n=1 Tax=Trichoderma parareesei TaxID=858221 RepID=A0A2H2ZIS0_TRIPA|nr:hypothetical protein A9Z42_0012290 [Trichoderma parareesei]
MSDWRERGEVPDSQDESDDYYSDHEAQLPVRASIPEAQGAEDIWAFPGSDDEEQRNIPFATAVPPFSTRPSLQARSRSVTTSLALVEDNFESQVQLSPPKLPETISSSLSASSPDEVASRNNQDTADAPSFANGNAIFTSGNNVASFASTLAASGEQPTTTEDNEVHHHAATLETADATSRHGRRLRPRNLIQEKPYFYDRVNYSNTFRKHGLIPVNVITESERRHASAASSDAASWDGDDDQDSQDIDILPRSDKTETGDFTAPSKEHDIHLLEPSSPVYLAPQQLQPMMIQTCQIWISSWDGHLLPERTIFCGTPPRFKLRPRDFGGEISFSVIRQNQISSLAESQSLPAHYRIGRIRILNEASLEELGIGRKIHFKRPQDLQVLAPWCQYPLEESKVKMSTVDKKVKKGLKAEAKPTAIHTKW